MNAFAGSMAMDPQIHQNKLDIILSDRPKFHSGELEITRDFSAEESLFPKAWVQTLNSREPVFYGIGDEATRFICASVNEGSRSLEVGLGVSTLAFSLKGADHTCITPFQSEIDGLKDYAKKIAVDVSRTTFIRASSDEYLKTCTKSNLDVVLIDGKHAFPFPIVDWFFTADLLKNGGLMIIDDVHIKTVRLLMNFMDSDPRWERVAGFNEKSFVYRKLASSVHDVAWHMQPYSFKNANAFRAKKIAKRAMGYVRRKILG